MQHPSHLRDTENHHAELPKEGEGDGSANRVNLFVIHMIYLL
ncbi:hypothetical protein [Providencia sp. PROV255]|nr:hypothetical protein [Providencia sp. PROV255]